MRPRQRERIEHAPRSFIRDENAFAEPVMALSIRKNAILSEPKTVLSPPTWIPGGPDASELQPIQADPMVDCLWLSPARGPTLEVEI